MGQEIKFPCAVVLRKWLFSSHGSELHKFRSSFPRLGFPDSLLSFGAPKARVKAMKSKSKRKRKTKRKLANGDD